MSVRLVDDVFLDLRAARDWYDRKSFGLGDEFADLFFTIAIVDCQMFPCITQLTKLVIAPFECPGSLLSYTTTSRISKSSWLACW